MFARLSKKAGSCQNFSVDQLAPFAKVAAPLTALGSPTARFVWDPEAQASFEALKQALSSAPVLRTVDRAGERCSRRLPAASQWRPSSRSPTMRVISIRWRNLTAAERNSPALIPELLAAVHALAFSGNHDTCLVVVHIERKAAGPTLIYGQTIRQSRGSRHTVI